MIFLKNIHWNMILFANVLKIWSFQKNRTGIWSFFYYQKKIIFLFSENMILFYRRKIIDNLSQKNTWNYDIIWYALKRWSFQKARTGIWSFFNYQERWYFYILEIWSHFLSPYLGLIRSDDLVFANYVFSKSSLYRYVILKMLVIL